MLGVLRPREFCVVHALHKLVLGSGFGVLGSLRTCSAGVSLFLGSGFGVLGRLRTCSAGVLLFLGSGFGVLGRLRSCSALSVVTVTFVSIWCCEHQFFKCLPAREC